MDFLLAIGRFGSLIMWGLLAAITFPRLVRAFGRPEHYDPLWAVMCGFALSRLYFLIVLTMVPVHEWRQTLNILGYMLSAAVGAWAIRMSFWYRGN